jgi:hypothetical protein
MSAEQSFARLLRTSRLASYDPHIPQVYTTFGRHRKRGDWGLKRNLPTTVHTNVITVQALDTPEHQTPFESAQAQVWQLERWKEAFPASQPPPPRSVNPPINILKLKPSEWRRFLRQVKERKDEWRAAVRENKYQAGDHLRFLNADYYPVNQTGERVISTTAVGPWYDWYPSTRHAVKGRTLNRIGSGFAVGVGGIVAMLPAHKVLKLTALTSNVNTFYVEQMVIDEHGRPEVQLSMLESTSAVSTQLPFRPEQSSLGTNVQPSMMQRGHMLAYDDRSGQAKQMLSESTIRNILSSLPSTPDTRADELASIAPLDQLMQQEAATDNDSQSSTSESNESIILNLIKAFEKQEK